jgi:hypothetical protein
MRIRARILAARQASRAAAICNDRELIVIVRIEIIAASRLRIASDSWIDRESFADDE